MNTLVAIPLLAVEAYFWTHARLSEALFGYTWGDRRYKLP